MNTDTNSAPLAGNNQEESAQPIASDAQTNMQNGFKIKYICPHCRTLQEIGGVHRQSDGFLANRSVNDVIRFYVCIKCGLPNT